MTYQEKKLMREYVVDGIRRFFKEADYLEVETPIFTPTPDLEPSIEPFSAGEVLASGKKVDGFLITSPEFAMKRILSSGSGSIFQITKAFRSMELPSDKHNGEFTILEWYRVGADYTYLMDECLLLLSYLAGFISQSTKKAKTALLQPKIYPLDSIEYQGKTYSLTSLEKISYAEAMKKYAGVTEEMIFDRTALVPHMREIGYDVKVEYSLLDLLSLLYVDKIEPNLGTERPTVIYDFPAEQAALSRKKVDDPRFAERFELYFAGVELGNAFSELTDVREQRNRFESQIKERNKAGRKFWSADKQFLSALENGLPPTAGIAVGVDRLAMLLLNATSITDVMWFSEKDWVFEV